MKNWPEICSGLFFHTHIMKFMREHPEKEIMMSLCVRSSVQPGFSMKADMT